MHKQMTGNIKDRRAMKKGLLRDERYSGKYVAVMNGQIVDADESDSELVKRMNSRYSDRSWYVGKVVEEEETLLIPGPFG